MNTATKNPVYRRRLLAHRIGITLSVLAMAFGIFFLLWILATLVVKGFGAITPAMFSSSTAKGSAQRWRRMFSGAIASTSPLATACIA